MPRKLLALLALAVFNAAWAQAPRDDELFRYKGPDRQAKLVEAAKKEGTLVLYTSLAPTESKPLADAFEKKYGVKVELWRALSDKVLQRTITEAQAHRNAVDVIETNGPEMEAIAQEHVLADVFSPYLADLPEGGTPAHHTWFPDRLNFFVVGYNTQRVKRADNPPTY